ncbi:hypothetical protein B7494_g846 [Chlorociboria aeruginascens]|nr:hypothetical protein B7494_g846 [Chlorociboria aeruginascens]
MTPNSNAGNDSSRSRDASRSSPLDRRTTTSTFSSSKFSMGSDDTGESNAAASERNSLATVPVTDALADRKDVKKRNSLDISKARQSANNGRESYRSHRNRSSGSFLMSDPTFESLSPPVKPSPNESSNIYEHKSKAALHSSDKRHSKRRSNVGTGSGSSPLATVVTNADPSRDATDNFSGENTGNPVSKPPTTGLDVDPAQIVSLALNLSESRRNAARRNMSTPMPPSVPGLGEGFAGGSLRHHLQQQRKISRNVSPKPDRSERAMTASPRLVSGQRITSPLQAAFDSQPGGGYKYHFSASTLARAENAKIEIELMAQYRRLLQLVPPLKPQSERPTTATSSESTTLSNISTRQSSITTAQNLGRQYNPLQYIRNRKVRARERRAIDGEAQGFGDLSKVSSWIDQLSKQLSSGEYQAVDCITMPNFSKAAEASASPNASPQSTLGKSQIAAPKVKRPRNDWVTRPADMISDVFWLEHDNNKKLIEDPHGRRIFPQDIDLKKSTSRMDEEPEVQKSPEHSIRRGVSAIDLRIDTKLPEFKSIKTSEGPIENAKEKARQRLHDARYLHRGHNGHSWTVDSDRGRDILEKQMNEMLAKEARENEAGLLQDIEGQQIMQSIEAQKPVLRDGFEKSEAREGQRSESEVRPLVEKNRVNKESTKRISSGRASLEVPGYRTSLEGLDSTAPNSPQIKPTKMAHSFIPSIAMDLSTSGSRHTSPTRRSLSKVRSRFGHFRDQSPFRGKEWEDSPFVGQAMSSKEQTAEVSDGVQSRNRSTSLSRSFVSGRYRSTSPSKDRRLGRARSTSRVRNMLSRGTDETIKPSKKTSSIRKGKPEEYSGIKGLFKGSRGPVARVSDFLWKKESSSIPGSSSDESDTADARDAQTEIERRHSSRGRSSSTYRDDLYASGMPSAYLSAMPIFTSPFERRGRSVGSRGEEDSTPQQGRDQRRKSSHAQVLLPPRIDVHNASPVSSPDLIPADRYQRDSDISDVESQRGGFSDRVESADARLNAILGLPGRRRDGLPITGLSSLETSDERPPFQLKRQWSISDSGVSTHRGPMTKREIFRVKALLLSSGIKAKEISRRAAEPGDLKEDPRYTEIVALSKEPIDPIPTSQQHILAAKIISNDIQLSSRMWQSSADTFCGTTVQNLLGRIDQLKSRVLDELTPMASKAADEADEVSKDIVTGQTLAVKRLTDSMDKMMRRRRRRFRWLRRGGWVLVEWALVGIMCHTNYNLESPTDIDTLADRRKDQAILEDLFTIYIMQEPSATVVSSIYLQHKIPAFDMGSTPPPGKRVDTVARMETLLNNLSNLKSYVSELFDTRGNNLGRHGPISTLKLSLACMPCPTMIMDVTTLMEDIFVAVSKNGNSLRRIMEDSLTSKLFVDFRQDSDALFTHYSIKIQYPVDLQLV